MAGLLGALAWLPLLWLREPALLLAWLVVVAILFGAGKPMGLPMLFWNEFAGRRYLAGLASTLLTAEIAFVLYLVQKGRQPLDRAAFVDHFVAVGIVWAALVLARAAQMALADRAPAEPGARSPVLGRRRAAVTPAVRAMAAHGSRHGSLVSARVSGGPFLAGLLTAALLVAGLLALDAGVGDAVDAWAAAVYGALFRRAPPANLHLHVAAATVFGLLAALFLAVRNVATPATGLCALLALFAGAYGFFTFWTTSRGIMLVAIVLLLWRAGRPLYKLRLPALEALYPPSDPPPPDWKGVVYPPPEAVAGAPRPGPGLLLDELADADGRPGDWAPAPLPEPGKRPLILVCTSGGGIRAAAWTAGVLGRLDALPGLRLCTRMVTGASGGMVGAAFWVAWRRRLAAELPDQFAPAAAGDHVKLLRAVAEDSLTPLARRLFFHDIPAAFRRRPNRQDRGAALEQAWVSHCDRSLRADLSAGLADFRDGEARAEWPSLVFSPMLVEDGRRLLISNLTLRGLLSNQADWVLPQERVTSVRTSSVTAYHLASLVPKAWPGFPLSTAARLSAAFPYVSPAAVLPTRPRRRVVDAGYYDNYGLDLACGWLREAIARHTEWLRAHVSAVLVIQIRDNVSELSVNPTSAAEQQRGHAAADRTSSALARGIEGVSTPPEGLLAARDSVALFRNDAQLDTVMQLSRRVFQTPDFVRTVAFEFQGDASLSWYLTRGEIANLEEQVQADDVTRSIDAIRGWLSANGGVPIDGASGFGPVSAAGRR